MRHYQRALITGATSGIGAAFAAELPEQTWLLLSGRDEERLAARAQELARPDRPVGTVAADLTEPDGIEQLVAAAEDFEVDLLINNAGRGRLGAVLDNPVEDELATVRLNVLAVVALTRRLLPGMIERAGKTGRRAGVIIVSSTAAFASVPYFATYAASKSFDLHFAEALAEELRGQPIDVLALCPGATRTEFGARAGYRSSGLPGAAEPRSVARGALSALGCQTVQVSGSLSQAALAPIVLPRRVAAGLIGRAMRLFVAGRP